MAKTFRNARFKWLLLLVCITFLFVGLYGCTKKEAEKAKDEPKTVIKSTKNSDKREFAFPEGFDFSKPVSLEEFPKWMKDHLNKLEWAKHKNYDTRLNRNLLEKTFDLAETFMVNFQKPEGNFHYQYDFVKKKMDRDDNQVRQAGSVWGLALIYQYKQDEKVRVALEKGLKFFFKLNQPGEGEGALLLAYPGDSQCQTGTVALIALSIVEYLRTEKDAGIKIDPAFRKEMLGYLDGYIKHLKAMQLDDYHFSKSYNLLTKSRRNSSSPYFDGETMLCLIKTAKYLDQYKDLIPKLEETGIRLARDYTIEAWRKNQDSDKTKGFFQWSCMAFWEYQDAGWKHSETLGDYVLSLSWWMLHVHKTLIRRKGTGYAYEGLTHAYKLAETRGMNDAKLDLAYTIDKGLYKMNSWQVGNPIENNFLKNHPTDDPLAVGGYMNHRKQPPLRVDVTQHTVHAVSLSLEWVYTKKDPDGPKFEYQ